MVERIADDLRAGCSRRIVSPLFREGAHARWNRADLDRLPVNHGTGMNFQQQVRIFLIKLIYQKISGFIQPGRPVDEVMSVAGHKMNQSLLQQLQGPSRRLRAKPSQQALCRDLQRDSSPDSPPEAWDVRRQMLVPFRVRHERRQSGGHEVGEHLLDPLEQGYFRKFDQQVA